MGLMGVCIPAKYGGVGFDYIAFGIVAEALEWADSSVRETLAVHLALNSMGIFQPQKTPILLLGFDVICEGVSSSVETCSASFRRSN